MFFSVARNDCSISSVTRSDYSHSTVHSFYFNNLQQLNDQGKDLRQKPIMINVRYNACIQFCNNGKVKIHR